jgi:hypothetical protein
MVRHRTDFSVFEIIKADKTVAIDTMVQRLPDTTSQVHIIRTGTGTIVADDIFM